MVNILDEINEGVDPYEGLILFPIPGNDLSYFVSLEDGFFPEISHWYFVCYKYGLYAE